MRWLIFNLSAEYAQRVINVKAFAVSLQNYGILPGEGGYSVMGVL